MTREEFLTALDALIAEKHLLKHPFYQLWSQGKLTRENLREYADLLLPARGRLPDVRLGRALRLRGRGAAAGAAREPDRGGARRREPSGALAAASRPRSARRRSCRATPAHPRGRRRDRGIPPHDPRGLGRRRARRALRLRVADSGGLEDQARGPGGLLRHRGRATRPASSRSTSRPTCGTGRSSARRSAASPTPRRSAHEALAAARRCCDALNRALDGVMRENALVC